MPVLSPAKWPARCRARRAPTRRKTPERGLRFPCRSPSVARQSYHRRSTVNSRCDKVAPRCFPVYFDNPKGSSMPGRKLTRQDLREAAEKYKNWGKWGPADEIGTLNHTRPEDIVAAARLVKKGKVISL